MADSPVPDLPDALERWRAERSFSAEAAVWGALASATLLVPVAAAATGTERSERTGLPAERGAELRLARLVEDDRQALLGFTSTAALAAWRDDLRPVPVAARDLARAAVDEDCDALVVDLGPGQFVVRRGDLAALADGYIPVAGDGAQLASRRVEAPLTLEAAADVPEGLPGAVRAALSTEPTVAEAYLLRGHLPGEDPLLVLGLVLPQPCLPAELAGLVQRLADRLTGVLPDSDGLDVTVLSARQRARAALVTSPVHAA